MSFMCKVRLGDRILEAKRGERLIELLQRYGIEAPHPCAGRGSCGKCRVLVDGREELSCKYVVEGDVTVTLTGRSGLDVRVLGDIGARDDDDLFFALDIGSTTLLLSLVERGGRELCRVGAQNPQIVFGADVITRIEQCIRGGALSLQKPLVWRINEMMAAARDAVGGRELSVKKLYAAGNATMLHLLLGIDCSSIGRAPYTPVFLEEREVEACSVGLCGVDVLHLLPSAHSFVGADVVAGLSLIDTPGAGRYALFCDLGTNAEIALVSADGILCTAAAAGPCFEGSNIDCGMSALSGAISSVNIDESGVRYETVGGVEARGICATGLLDTIYGLLYSGEIDEGGYMEDKFFLSDKVYLSPSDVRSFQLAKSAVHSAMEALVAKAGIGFDSVDTLYLSGGFSKKLSPLRAAAVGLIPMSLRGKCAVIEESCLNGIIKFACGGRDAGAIATASRYCDLSTDSYFAEKFIDNMSFEL